MSRHVTHYIYYSTEPSESDPDGTEELACGAEIAHKSTIHKSSVSCKRCIRLMINPPSRADIYEAPTKLAFAKAVQS